MKTLHKKVIALSYFRSRIVSFSILILEYSRLPRCDCQVKNEFRCSVILYRHFMLSLRTYFDNRTVAQCWLLTFKDHNNGIAVRWLAFWVNGWHKQRRNWRASMCVRPRTKGINVLFNIQWLDFLQTVACTPFDLCNNMHRTRSALYSAQFSGSQTYLSVFHLLYFRFVC